MLIVSEEYTTVISYGVGLCTPRYGGQCEGNLLAKRGAKNPEPTCGMACQYTVGSRRTITKRKSASLNGRHICIFIRNSSQVKDTELLQLSWPHLRTVTGLLGALLFIIGCAMFLPHFCCKQVYADFLRVVVAERKRKETYGCHCCVSVTVTRSVVLNSVA